MRSIRSLLLAAALAACIPVHADEGLPQKVSLAIEQQSLRDALNQLAAQTGLQIMRRDEEVSMEGITAPRVVGELSPSEALERLLAGTHLTYEFVNAKTVKISSIAAPAGAPSASAESVAGSADGLRVAQADGTPGVQEQQPISAGEDDQEHVQLDEIVVTGTHIRGSRNVTAPLIVLSREAIEKTGYSTTQDLIRSLPQNFSGGAAGATEDGLFTNSAFAGANNDSSSGINLRGLGNSSTLVLINGHRVASSAFGLYVDVANIPLSAVERIEILPDGSSAIYGSDAVGGVVNFILRKDYQGASTSLRYGSVTSGDRDEILAAQTLGAGWSGGGIVANLQYQRQDSLDAADRDFSSSLPAPNDLLPSNKSYSASLNVHHALTERLELYGDALYTQRKVERTFTSDFASTESLSKPEATAVFAGLRYDITPGWSASASSGFSRLFSNYSNSIVFAFLPDVAFPTRNDVAFDEWSGEAMLTGQLNWTQAGPLGLAMAVSWRNEQLDQDGVQPISAAAIRRNTNRDVSALFGEIRMPLVGAAQQVPLVHSLELSAAFRYDDYSDVGATGNPRFGIRWEPYDSLALRGSYSESFRAPNASEILGEANSFLIVNDVVDPQGPGTVPAFILVGSAANLRPERAHAVNLGLEYQPQRAPGLKLSVDYYDITYGDRITSPPFDLGALLSRPVYGPLITDLADDAQAQAYQQAAIGSGAIYIDQTLAGSGIASVRNVLDFRTQNAALVEQSGFDILIGYTRPVGAHTLDLRLNATEIDRIDTAFARGAAPTDLVDTFQNPTSWRGRLDTGMSGHGWGLNAAINYVDRYVNTALIERPPIGSWTTFDLVARLDVGELSNSPSWQDTSLTLTVLNAFDRDPPFVSAPAAVNVSYDAANANPLGRFIAAEVSRRW